MRKRYRRTSTGSSGVRHLVAGPGLGEPATAVVLVPVHPQTGAVWQPRAGAVPIPVDAALWAELAFPSGRGGGRPTHESE
ncbi:hypothetical protein [Streptomyces sp. CBMA152]|uniref:hypothetical protein n=1 Tax=Streptomyces sp. CBMA152 TaxID=1896312 RepID=UPI0016612F2E|nr:hypothetical protein [Streptomyces sp. CBMA152]